MPELLASWGPQVLVSQHGADTHAEDPLAHLGVSLDAQRAVMETCHALAHEHADGRWLALGGGGYAVVDVVPRSWAHLCAISAYHPVLPATEVPESWRAEALRRTGQQAPYRMTDGRDASWADWDAGYDPGSPLDRAVRAARRTAFPAHGLLP